jgi:hypothetical protein
VKLIVIFVNHAESLRCSQHDKVSMFAEESMDNRTMCELVSQFPGPDEALVVATERLYYSAHTRRQPVLCPPIHVQSRTTIFRPHLHTNKRVLLLIP